MNVLEKYQISPEELGVLQFVAINSKQSDYVRKCIESFLFSAPYPDGELLYLDWEKKDWISFIKAVKKTDTLVDLVRLGTKGQSIVKTYGDAGEHPLMQFTFDTVKELYKKNNFEALKIKGGKDVYHSISEFLHYKSHYSDKMIKAVLRAYVESFKLGEEKYALRIDTLFWKKPNAFTKKWDPSNCPIIDWIDSNNELILKVYKKL